jgi:hypothetical protein
VVHPDIHEIDEVVGHDDGKCPNKEFIVELLFALSRRPFRDFAAENNL